MRRRSSSPLHYDNPPRPKRLSAGRCLPMPSVTVVDDPHGEVPTSTSSDTGDRQSGFLCSSAPSSISIAPSSCIDGEVLVSCPTADRVMRQGSARAVPSPDGEGHHLYEPMDYERGFRYERSTKGIEAVYCIPAALLVRDNSCVVLFICNHSIISCLVVMLFDHTG